MSSNAASLVLSKHNAKIEFSASISKPNTLSYKGQRLRKTTAGFSVSPLLLFRSRIVADLQ
jgi:hypothetical protein